MSKTISSVLSMVMVLFFAHSQWRLNALTQTVMVKNEVEMMAAEKVAELHDYVGLMPFEANATFGGGTRWNDAHDVDDFDGVQDTVSVQAPLGTMRFLIVAEVHYVDKQADTFVPSEAPTRYKEVTLTLQTPYADPALRTTITTSRVYAQKS